MSLAHEVVQRFAAGHPLEAARVLGGQDPAAVGSLLSRLREADAAALLARMAAPAAAATLEAADPAHGGRWLARLPPERAAALLRRLDPGPRERVMAGLPGAHRLRPLVDLPEDTAGALMDPKVPALPGDLDLEEVRRRLGRDPGGLALELYVVDTDQRLVGVADLGEALASSRGGPLAGIARPIEPLPAEADLTAMAAHPGWSERGSLPVVDERGTYLGAVRAQRLRQATEPGTAQRSHAEREAVLALGELFWLGLSGAFTGLARREPGGEDR
jgi:magnesium transporter